MLEGVVIPIVVALALLLAGFVALSLLPAVFIKRRMKRELESKTRGKLAITYDDGPGAKLTPPLLNTLAEHGAKASFFFVGFRAERHPEACEAIAAAGHEVGNHTHWHLHSWRTALAPWRAARDVGHGYQTMNRWMAGDAPFRPPFGKLTLWTWLACRRRWPGASRLSFWTADGGDTWPHLPNAQAVAREIVDKGGAVVLLHSHDRGEDRQRYVLEITEHLLRAARERGLRVCTMSEILNGRRMLRRQISREGAKAPRRKER